MPELTDINRITADPAIHQRVDPRWSTVLEYSRALEAGAEFPPAIAFDDGSTLWLSDGFLRLEAYKKAKRTEILCEIRPGTKRDALLFACGANAAHGARRSNADKRRAVSTLLEDESWCQWSDHQIGKAAGVSHPLVASIRGGAKKSEKRLAKRHGKTIQFSAVKAGRVGRKSDEDSSYRKGRRDQKIADAKIARHLGHDDVALAIEQGTKVTDLPVKPLHERPQPSDPLKEAIESALARGIRRVVDIAGELEQLGLINGEEVSMSTMRRRLSDMGYVGLQ
jgi:hypothetical protein